MALVHLKYRKHLKHLKHDKIFTIDCVVDQDATGVTCGIFVFKVPCCILVLFIHPRSFVITIRVAKAYNLSKNPLFFIFLRPLRCLVNVRSKRMPSAEKSVVLKVFKGLNFDKEIGHVQTFTRSDRWF